MSMQAENEPCFYREWRVDKPLAVLVIAHGLGEHSGRYAHVAGFFIQQGIAVAALDHRGHGQSPGRRGHIEDFSHYCDDLHALIQLQRTHYPGVPVHLLGHSMGGLIATGYALRHGTGIASLMLSSPAYGVNGASNKLSLLVAPLLALLLPTTGLSNGLDANAVSRDPVIVQAYLDDPLVHNQVTPSWARAFRREQRFIAEEIEQLALPVLMMLAGTDSLTDSARAQMLFEKITAPEKHLKVYPEAFHELLNEPEQQQVLAAVLNWINDRVERN